MVKVKKEQMVQIEKLFTGVEDSMVIACFQGYMGDAYADKLPDPTAAVIISGEYSFWGGNAGSDAALEIAKGFFKLAEGDSSVAIYGDDNLAWRELLLSIPENNPVEEARYGIVQKDYEFNRTLLQNYVDALPEGYELAAFDETLYEQAMSEDWSREFCETFASCNDYLKRGFGFAAMYKGKLVSGASTMTVYDGGTEIQVATRADFRRKGLAMPCAAALILECSKRGIRACWDAATLTSKYMALKLGYEYKGEYSTIHMHK